MVVLGLFAVWCLQVLPLARGAPWFAARSPKSRCAAPGRETPPAGGTPNWFLSMQVANNPSTNMSYRRIPSDLG